MKLELTWANCFWLIVPILLWNILLGSKITQEQITSDAHSPAWLLGAENIFRLVSTFILPLLLRMKVDISFGKIGLKLAFKKRNHLLVGYVFSLCDFG